MNKDVNVKKNHLYVCLKSILTEKRFCNTGVGKGWPIMETKPRSLKNLINFSTLKTKS